MKECKTRRWTENKTLFKFAKKHTHQRENNGTQKGGAKTGKFEVGDNLAHKHQNQGIDNKSKQT